MEGTKFIEEKAKSLDDDELSDDTQEEQKAFEKNQFELSWTGLDKVTCAEGARVVIAAPGAP